MRKFTKKSSVVLYGCSGLGVNMLNIIIGSYLCSALLVGGFEDHVENWTYLNKDLVVAGLWGAMIVIAKIVDGLIDLPLSHFVDNLQVKWGKRKTAIVMGYIPMIVAYLLFLIPLQTEATWVNTLWFGGLLLVFYTAYTLTMITYYATFAEVAGEQGHIVLLSNVKSVCDVVYFSLSYALVPLFVSMGVNIRWVALLFLPLSLTMVIPLVLLKENRGEETKPVQKVKRPTFIKSLLFTMKDKPYVLWLGVLFVMNLGLQLFLGGINEFFSNTGINMTFVMACCFAPVPLTILLYNKITKRFGLGVAYRYVLAACALGMGLMVFCRKLPENWMLPYAIFCSLIVSLSIGAFFAVTYTVPSQRAADRKGDGETASSMYFAVQGLFEGASAGLATGPLLVFLKQNDDRYGLVGYLTVLVAFFCMAAFGLSFLLPKAITKIGKKEKSA